MKSSLVAAITGEKPARKPRKKVEQVKKEDRDREREKEKEKEVVYLDAAATVPMPAKVIAEMVKWANQGNPSSSSKSSLVSAKRIDETRDYILKTCGVNGRKSFKCIFNSGASEGNSYVIRSVAESFIAMTKVIPHFVVSAIEHKSVLLQIDRLQSLGMCTVTYIQPDILGQIRPADVEKSIVANTAMVIIMAVNNETGAMMPIQEIGAVAHKHSVLYHCDVTQLISKSSPMLGRDNIDSVSMSFHKFGGPLGSGCVVIRNDMITGYSLGPVIAGVQEYGLRGGTENTPAIAAAGVALDLLYTDREEKNRRLVNMIGHFIRGLTLNLSIPCISIEEYMSRPPMHLLSSSGLGGSGEGMLAAMECVIVCAETTLSNIRSSVLASASDSRFVPNILMISFVKRAEPYVCNVEIKKELENRGIIVSIGSACNTASQEASHVVTAMRFDQLLKKGVIRISMSDYNTIDDLNKCIAALTEIVKKL